MSCPQTMILQISRNFKLLRRRAWDKDTVNLSRLNTCNRVKTTNPEYKNTQQDLTGWKLSFPTLKGMQAFKDMYVVNYRFLSNSTKEGGVLCQKLSSYSLLVSESRSEEHTSELQSHSDLVCRLLLEKKKGSLQGDDRTLGRKRRRSEHGVPAPVLA